MEREISPSNLIEKNEIANFSIEKNEIAEIESTENFSQNKENDLVRSKLSKIRRTIQDEIKSSDDAQKGANLNMREDEGGNLIVEITNSSGEVFSINDHIPDNIPIKKDNQFAYSNSRKEIYVEDEENTSKFLISLFHEIGHADYFKKGKNLSVEPLLKFYMDLGSFVGMCFKATDIFITKVLKNRKNIKVAYGETLNITTNLEEEDFYPDWFKRYQDKLRAKSERYAWQYALSELKKIKQKKFDVFSGFANVKEMIAYIDDCLLSYEQHSANSVDHETANYDPIFLKKIKKEFSDLK